MPTEGGIEDRILALTQGFGLDALILTATRSDDPLNLAMRLARRKGRVVVETWGSTSSGRRCTARNSTS